MENNIDNTVDTQQQQQQNEDKEVKTFTQEDIDKAVAEATKDLLSQDKVNEIVEKRLAREREKAGRERTQAEELAKLSAEERKIVSVKPLDFTSTAFSKLASAVLFSIAVMRRGRPTRVFAERRYGWILAVCMEKSGVLVEYRIFFAADQF